MTKDVSRIGFEALRSPVHLVALGFGTGLSPVAPGTFGTLLALVPAWFMSYLSWSWQLGIAVTVCAAGVWICGESARRLGVHDHPAIVFDEIAAMLLLVPLIPSGPLWLGAAFVLFRIFDVVKPWPIRDVDHRMGGGLGIMLDDLMAAIFTALCLQVLRTLQAVA
jgi:phosphatidylglycerophosphatase A